ncbi:winged helix-turn-helix transcriptional regulator [Sodalis sp. RH22]|uniref:winged helix-turn-helix transcriptional regulator n=1 Tax=unclassified Sodalis (in: enterobacteria) TaxID=2636512 RepID=UPI0039B6AC1A
MKNVLAERLRRRETFDANCPHRRLLSHITSRWGTLALITMIDGPHRFGALKRKMGGITDRMLIKTLHELEKDSMIVRQVYQIMPPHTEYELTKSGKEAAVHIENLTDWIADYLDQQK